MKLITCRHQNDIPFVAVVAEDISSVLPVSAAGLPYTSMNELIEKITDEELSSLSRAFSAHAKEAIPFAEVELLAPIPVPKQDILCLGINYMEHAVESARYKQEDFTGERPYPVYFCMRVNECTPTEAQSTVILIFRRDWITKWSWRSSSARTQRT